MKLKNSIFFLVLFSIIFFGCKKEKFNLPADMVGDWYYSRGSTSQYSLLLGAGNSSYNEPRISSEADPVSYSGIASIDGNRLSIGKKYSVTVNTFPGYDTIGNNIMIVGGRTYTAASFPQYARVHVSNDTTYFLWNVTSDAKTEIDYRVASTSTWQKVFVGNYSSSGTHVLTGLIPVTLYEWQMKSINGEGDREHSSKYTAIQTFTTN